MALAVILYVIHRWATGKNAVTLPIVLSGVFVIFVIAVLDSTRAAPFARGLAWLFFVVAAYNAIPAFTGLINSARGGIAKNAQNQ